MKQHKGKWDPLVNPDGKINSCLFRANGYVAIAFPNFGDRFGNKQQGWYGINRGEGCMYTSEMCYTSKQVKRRALRHLFRLPKLN